MNGLINPKTELADILRCHRDNYIQNYIPNNQQRRVMSAIISCRTPVLGGFVEECDQCHDIRVVYHSCRNRHCPKCQQERAHKWIEKRKSELLPTNYFHIVFTIPDTLKKIAVTHSKIVYDLMLKSAQETLLELAEDTQYLGAKLGGFSVLHTWTQTLEYHPHIHCVVTGGGLNIASQKWISTKKSDFILPIRVVSSKFQGKLLSNLKLYAEINSFDQNIRAIRKAYNQKWVVYAKPPFSGSSSVVEYLGRYTHRIAISNSRIIKAKEDEVTFVYKDRKDGGKTKLLTLPTMEFIQRFLMHVLPSGFVKIRYFGLLSSRKKTSYLQIVRDILNSLSSTPETLPVSNSTEIMRTKNKVFRCPSCKLGIMETTGIRLGRANFCRSP